MAPTTGTNLESTMTATASAAASSKSSTSTSLASAHTKTNYAASVSKTSTQATELLSTSVQTPVSNPAWIVPLGGLSGNMSTQWGANVSNALTLNGHAIHKLPVIISNQTLNQENATIAHIEGLVTVGLSTNTTTLALNESFSALTLGPNYNLKDTSGLYQRQFPTVPFGINLGETGRWNGSLIFGDKYDANRVQTSIGWTNLFSQDPYTETEPLGPEVFVDKGRLFFGDVDIVTYVWDPTTLETNPFPGSRYTAIHAVGVKLDFNSDVILVPKTYDICGKNITVDFGLYADAFSSGSTYGFPIPANLTQSEDRCQESELLDDIIILGKPFFQATYIYVPPNGRDVWATPAHQFDMPVLPETFQKDQFMLEHAPSGPPDNHIAAKVGGAIGGLVFVLLLTAALYFFMRRRDGKQGGASTAEYDSMNSDESCHKQENGVILPKP